MYEDIQAINEKIERESEFVTALNDEIGKVIVGQKYMIDRLLVGLLADGHVLLEGVPGLAKTMAVKTLSDSIRTSGKHSAASKGRIDDCKSTLSQVKNFMRSNGVHR